MEREREEGLMREGASSVSLLLCPTCYVAVLELQTSMVRSGWTELTVFSDASSWRTWRAGSDSTTGWAGGEAFTVEIGRLWF